MATETSHRPGVGIESILHRCSEHSDADLCDFQARLSRACRKLCLMWQATKYAAKAERDFYSETLQESPALYGQHAVVLTYHLEASVLFARSSLDIASRIFGWALPDPFPRRDFGSFNKLTKAIIKVNEPRCLSSYLAELRNDPVSWLNIISGSTRGRSLRDQISHQTEFPIEYRELNSSSEKESPVVVIAHDAVPLELFLATLRDGVVKGFCTFEQECISHLNGLVGTA